MKRSLVLAALAAIVGMLALGGAGGAGAGNNKSGPVIGWKCYRITQTSPRFEPFILDIKDQFERRESRVLAPVAFCAPVHKHELGGDAAGAGPTAQEFVVSPEEFLMCYRLEFGQTEPAFRERTIFTLDKQFGPRALRVIRPTRICSEADSDLAPCIVGNTAGFCPDGFSPSVNGIPPAFKCYKARNAGPPFVPLNVFLEDEVSAKAGTIGKPNAFCALASKIGERPNPEREGPFTFPHLTCYALTQEQQSVAQVQVEDKFGVRSIVLGRAESYCVISLKVEGDFLP